MARRISSFFFFASGRKKTQWCVILFVYVRGTTQRNARCTLTVRRDHKLFGKSKQATVQRFFFFLLNFNSRKRKIREKIRDQKDFLKI